MADMELTRNVSRHFEFQLVVIIRVTYEGGEPDTAQ